MKFDNILNKAKDVFEKAYKKADNVILVQKQKIDAAGLENKLSKDYETLGKLCFEEMQKGAFCDNKELCRVADIIKNKKAQIDEIRREVQKNKSKKQCAKCGAVVDKKSRFCAECGESFSEE